MVAFQIYGGPGSTLGSVADPAAQPHHIHACKVTVVDDSLSGVGYRTLNGGFLTWGYPKMVGL